MAVILTHPDRVLFPDTGLTKQGLAAYYARVAARMLPHLADRPLSFVRCPEGLGGDCFYQKHWTGDRPAALRQVTIRQADGRRKPYVMVGSVDGLLALVQFGVIEIHPWGARADALERPDRIVFDLDPASGVPWSAVRDAAKRLRHLLAARALASWVKSTGGKGLHVVVPIARGPSWDEVSGFARSIAVEMATDAPGRYLATASKSRRKGHIFIDWLRNVRGATSVAPWSVRARRGAPVSAPWGWNRLGSLRAADAVRVRGFRLGADPWEGILRERQRLRVNADG